MTVYLLSYSVDGSALPILPLVYGFYGLCAVLLHGRQWIVHSSSRQWLSQRFVRYIALQMVSDCLHLRSSTAFTTVCAPYCSADGSVLLIVPLVNGFHNGLCAVIPRRWQCIARSSTRQHLSWFACRFAQRMAAHCSFIRLSTAFTTVFIQSY